MGQTGRIETSAAERRLALFLRLLAAVLLAAALVCALGPIDDFFGQPPFVVNSVVAITLLGLICLYAAGNLRGRIELVAIVIAAHLVSLAAIGSMLAFGETGGAADVLFLDTTVENVLWGVLAVDAVIAAALLGLLRPARRAVRGAGMVGAEVESTPTAGERRLRTALLVLVALFALAAVAYELGPLIDTTEQFAVQLPFVAGSVVGAATLAMVCAYAVRDLRRNLALVGPVVAAQLLAAVVGGVYLLVVDTGYELPLLGGEVNMTAALGVAVGLLLVPAIVLGLLYRAAWRERYGLSFFWPAPYRALIAVADVLVAGPDERVSAEQIGVRVERFLYEFRATRRWLYRVALSAIQLAPLIELRPRPRINPPLSELDPESRRDFLVDHYQRLPNQRAFRFIKHIKQVTIRICQQLAYAGYYGNRRVFDSIGYKPFSERESFRQLAPPEPGPHPLQVERAAELDPTDLEADVCIVGSGAAGAILAYELAKRKLNVLVLERGRYLEPRHFTEDEIEMISALYADGLMQQTEDWRFTILQGSCVGGSTTVNNAVCFPPPEAAVAEWNDPARNDARIDAGELDKSVAAIERFISVVRQPEDILNPSAGKFVDGAAQHGASPDRLEVDVVRANIDGCLGSGYCNIGCKWGKKLSMLETSLPWAQRDFPGRLRIVADARVERIHTGSGDPNPVIGLEVKAGERRLIVRADKYVISAGAVGSSYLLLQSGVGRGLPVGAGFSANMGAPLTAEFDDPQDAFAGLQISHYGIPKTGNGFVFETWFNPPVAQALNMPGWFEKHFENMRRYRNLMAVGVLVGTESNGKVIRALTGGPGVDFTPKAADLATLARGLKLLGEILFAAGAKRVMVNTWGDDEFTDPGQLESLDRICADPDYIALGTGHPQGGNAISHSPKRGVVGPDFKVHGHANLYICDASVFPTSLTVNPQLTVMSLAHYAAPRIAGEVPSPT